MFGKQKSSRRPSHSKSSNSKPQNLSTRPAQSEPARPAPSFLFIANEIRTNDDPDIPGSIPQRLVNGRWHPPEVAHGFLTQQPGQVYRWNNGIVSLAHGYEWVAQPVAQTEGDAAYANGTIVYRRSGGNVWPTYYRAATVFYCNHFDKFFTARGDVTTRDTAIYLDPVDWWQPLSFRHEEYDISCVDHAGDQEFLAVRHASWIEQLLPNTYRRHDLEGPEEGGLAGLLSIVVALVAFTCTNRSELRRALIDDRAWRGHRWVPHQRDSGRIPKRGIIATIYLDPDNLRGSTNEILQQNIEEGNTPIFR